MQTVVKKWFREKESGFLDNGGGSDILVSKDNLVNCKFLKVGAMVEFECHSNDRGLVAKKVKLLPQNKLGGHGAVNRSTKPFRPGVMT